MLSGNRALGMYKVGRLCGSGARGNYSILNIKCDWLCLTCFERLEDSAKPLKGQRQ